METISASVCTPNIYLPLSSMKKQILLAVLVLGAMLPLQATLYSTGNVNGSGTSLNQAIPDGTYPVGVSASLIVSGEGGSLSYLTVTLNISGGYNGDLYGYLSYNGTLVTLLNRVGTGSGDSFGFSTAGFNNVTLADGGTSIHDVANPSGLGSQVTYAPDGGSLSAFNGMNPNGTWTLFLADNAHPDQSTLVGWSLDITAVPEPVDYALAIFGVLFVAVGVARHVKSKAPARWPQP
jgi:subtilisin-like proprotein convertase family protein